MFIFPVTLDADPYLCRFTNCAY